MRISGASHSAAINLADPLLSLLLPEQISSSLVLGKCGLLLLRLTMSTIGRSADRVGYKEECRAKSAEIPGSNEPSPSLPFFYPFTFTTSCYPQSLSLPLYFRSRSPARLRAAVQWPPTSQLAMPSRRLSLQLPLYHGLVRTAKTLARSPLTSDPSEPIPGSKTYTSDFTHWVPNVQASETCGLSHSII